MKISIKVTHVGHDYSFYKLIYEGCCDEFINEMYKSINVNFLECNTGLKVKVGIIKEPYIDYDMDENMDGDMEVVNEELQYSVRKIKFCPFCGELINIELEESNVEVEEKKYLDYLEADSKEKKKIKLTMPDGSKVSDRNILNMFKTKYGQNLEIKY